MNLWIQFLSLLLSLFTSEPKSNSEIQDRFFKVYFEQGEKVIVPDNDEVSLNAAPFDIVFEFPKPMGLLVHASLNPETYNEALENKPLKKLPGFENTGMAEGMFNTNSEILLSMTAPNFWFYDSDTENRFNETRVLKDKIICKRHVEKLNDVDLDVITKIENATKPLYLVFVHSEPDGKEQMELNRIMVEINWND